MTSSLDIGEAVDVVYIDFEKAFDKVDTGILLNKLMFIKTPVYLVSWLRNFLLNRHQRVRVRNTYSDDVTVLSGVPQGCVISPLLFLIYVNDIFSLPLSSPIKLFADDSKIYNMCKFHDKLQNDLATLNDWCLQHKMKINISKTVFMRFGKSAFPLDYKIQNECIKQVNQVKDLGVIVDYKLSFKDHCLKVVKNSNFLIYNFLKIFKFCDFRNKYYLFKIYIKPILEYNILFYYPITKNCEKFLENIQKRFTKKICPKGLNYGQRLELLDDMSIQKGLMINALLFMYKIIFCNLSVDGFKYEVVV